MIGRSELQDAARKAFADGSVAPDAAGSWGLIADMGWLMMGVPEALGGLGLGREADAVIHAELGRALVPGPAIAQLLVITALCDAPDLPDRDGLLARAMGGEVMTASLAGECAGGTLTCVPDADIASHVLLVAPGAITLHPLAGAKITPRETWDKTRRLFDVVVNNPATREIAGGAAADLLCARLDTQCQFALAGDSLGAAGAILALTVDYLKTRRQFDRPLAMFQALKHRVADLKTAHAAADALYWSRATSRTTLTEAGALKAHATTVAATIAEEAIQLHGGIGLTSDHHCHLFLKRTMLNSALGGGADKWHELAGRQVLETAAP
jgi:alkylation response protein AidB-like acyl-CoA dehydrogenase